MSPPGAAIRVLTESVLCQSEKFPVRVVIDPHGPTRRGSRIYAVLIGAAALTGASIAARQSWMQLYPPVIPECGPGLEFMLGSFPLAEALPMIFRGAGDCVAVDWTFLGLSIANWSLLTFTATIVFALWMLLRPENTR